MPVCGNYLFFELPKKIVLNPKDGGEITVEEGDKIAWNFIDFSTYPW